MSAGGCCTRSGCNVKALLLGLRFRKQAAKLSAVTVPAPKQEAAVRINAMVKGYLTRRWFRKLYKHQRAMPRPVYVFVVAFLIAAKLLLSAALLVAAARKSHWAPKGWANPLDPEFETPFQKHPHAWGQWFQTMVAAHVATGCILFATFALPCVTRKGGTAHLVFGRLFVLAWMGHLVDGLVNSVAILATRGYDSNNYPESGFSMYLYVQFGFVGSCIIDFLVNGLTSVQFKLAIPNAFRAIMLWSTAITMAHALVYTGIGLLLVGYRSPSAAALEYGIVFVVQCPVYLYLVGLNFYNWWSKDMSRKLHFWVVEHNRNMVMASNLTVITGMANISFKWFPSLTVYLWVSQEVVVLAYAWWSTRALRANLTAATTFMLEKRRRKAGAPGTKGSHARVSVTHVVKAAKRAADESPPDRRRSSVAVAPEKSPAAEVPGVVQSPGGYNHIPTRRIGTNPGGY